MEQERETIDFVPAENNFIVAQQVRDWILANAFMGLGDEDGRNLRVLENYEGGHLNLTIGGYVPHPTLPGKRLRVEASFNVASNSEHRLDTVLDPEGTTWYRHTFAAQVSWGGEGSMPSPVARLRAQVVAAAAELAERFDAHFAGTIIWSKGMTKAEREERAARWARDATQLKVAAYIKESIHTTCRGMRVNDERWLRVPEDGAPWAPGKYEAIVEKKTYRVEVRSAEQAPNPNRRFYFRRVE